MTISSTQIFGLVNIVGGVVVLGSYGYGIMAFPKLRQGLWGGIHGRWRLVFTLSMFLAAVGTGAMLLGTASYWITLREVATAHSFRSWRPILLLAFVMSLAGMALFVAIAKRLV